LEALDRRVGVEEGEADEEGGGDSEEEFAVDARWLGTVCFTVQFVLSRRH
jgi:hypothetical protein